MTHVAILLFFSLAAPSPLQGEGGVRVEALQSRPATPLTLPSPLRGEGSLPSLKGTARKVLWSAEKAVISQPVFSPDGKLVAFCAVVGPTAQVIVASAQGGQPRAVWTSEGGAVECSQLGFSADGAVLAALVRHEKGGTVRRGVLFGPLAGPLDWLGVDEAIYEFAFAPDGRRMAVSTAAGIVLAPLGSSGRGTLVLAGQGDAERRAPYDRLQFAPDGTLLSAVGPTEPPFTVQGQGGGVVLFLGGAGPASQPAGRRVDLGVSAPEVVISPDSRQVACSVWQFSPVGVERPGGLAVWDVADLRAGKTNARWALDPKRFIAGLHVYPGAVFWIDGRLSCLATELQPEPGQSYRRFGVWQDSPAGAPARLRVIGPMPKRMWPDPGARGRIFWRYNAAAGMYLLDERTGRLWRFDDALTTRQGTLAVAPDLRRLAVVEEGQVILTDLQEGE